MRNLIQDGVTVDLVAPAAVQPGDLVRVGDLVGVAVTGATSGNTVPVRLEGVFGNLQTTGTTPAAGQTVFYDVGEDALTLDDDTGANPRVGICVAPGRYRLG